MECSSVCPKEMDNREKNKMLLLKLYLILWELNKNIVKNISRDQCWNNLEVASQVRPKTRGTFNRKKKKQKTLFDSKAKEPEGPYLANICYKV